MSHQTIFIAFLRSPIISDISSKPTDILIKLSLTPDFSNSSLVICWWVVDAGCITKVFDLLDENNKYKFVHIDVDLYQPTFDTLNYIYDKVVKGGIIITDDYRSPSFPGNQKAWEKYFNSKNILSLSLPSGQAVVIKE